MYGRIKSEIAYARRQIDRMKECMRTETFISVQPSYTETLKTRITFFQHERLIHLLVTILFALLTFASIVVTVIAPGILMAIVSVLLLSLLLPYIVHYFHLENGVQQLYLLYDEWISLFEEDHE